MKLLFIVLFAAVTIQATKLTKWSQNVTTDENLNIDQEWTDFKKTHGRTFHKLVHEEERKAIFENNLKMIKTHNAKFEKGLSSYKMAVNQFTDMTSEEFSSVMLPQKMVDRSPQKGITFLPPMNIGKLPEEVDWRKEGYVTPVKNQTIFCGSCWAFGAVGSIEGQNFRKTGKLVSLSEQNLVDCSTSNHGCRGGYPSKAFEDLTKSSGIDTEDSYPYVGYQRRCRFNNNTVGATIYGYFQIEENNEIKLQEALATVGPIAIVMNGKRDSFKHYSKGVYYDSKCTASYPRKHVMLLVGYGTEDGMDYWLAKNSWDVTWGEKGYIKMARNKNNHCGIAMDANYPIL